MQPCAAVGAQNPPEPHATATPSSIGHDVSPAPLHVCVQICSEPTVSHSVSAQSCSLAHGS